VERRRLVDVPRQLGADGDFPGDCLGELVEPRRQSGAGGADLGDQDVVLRGGLLGCDLILEARDQRIERGTLIPERCSTAVRSASVVAAMSAGAVAAIRLLRPARRSESVIEGMCSRVIRRWCWPSSTKENHATMLAASVRATAPAIAM
jgi:hypothetical protein